MTIFLEQKCTGVLNIRNEIGLAFIQKTKKNENSKL